MSDPYNNQYYPPAPVPPGAPGEGYLPPGGAGAYEPPPAPAQYQQPYAYNQPAAPPPGDLYGANAPAQGQGDPNQTPRMYQGGPGFGGEGGGQGGENMGY